MGGVIFIGILFATTGTRTQIRLYHSVILYSDYNKNGVSFLWLSLTCLCSIAGRGRGRNLHGEISRPGRHELVFEHTFASTMCLRYICLFAILEKALLFLLK